jgi:diguanylate cyclase (GGDEF)-like protein/PAS domain S-box-containing protein
VHKDAMHPARPAPARETGEPQAGGEQLFVRAEDAQAFREALTRAEERFRGLAELSPSALVGGRADGTIIFANAAVEPLLGWQPDELIACHVTILWPRRFHEHYCELLWDILDDRPARGPALEGEFVMCTRDGPEITVHVSSRWVDTETGPVSICALTDLSERDRVERVLRSLAERDPLTGLLNRRRFEEELTAQVARASRYRERGALVTLDVDALKHVNDTLGHAAGDALLRAVAERVGERLRESDALGRLGGDEFAVLLPQVSPAQAQAAAQGLLDALRAEPFHLHGQHLRITASAGVSAIGGRATAAEALLMEADLALYEAKESGRDRVAVFTAAGQTRMQARRSWADRIRDALAQDGFELHAQPIVDLATGARSRFELLLRLPQPDAGPALPAVFLPVAERFDLMRSVDRWVTRRATELLERAPETEDGPLHLHVNLAGATVGDPELPRLVETAARTRGVDPRRLTFEIAETAAITDLEAARCFATALRRLGAEVALDDFGRGFASFYYVKQLPIDAIKIGGDFVRELAEDPTDRLVVRSMAAMASGLGLRTIAQHAVDERAVALLREFGVDWAQGDHLGAPAAVDAVLSTD